ncbi:MAG: DUF5684 domain-containing protein [Gemmatimonadales bacterium]
MLHPFLLELQRGGAQTSSGGALGGLIALGIVLTVFIAAWKVFVKADKPGWAIFVPFYNAYVMLKIVGRPGWWLILFIIPLVNVVISAIVYIDLAKSFGKGVGFGLGLLFLNPIFISILGYGAAEYIGPAAARTT